jgi:hypothetical protein
MEKSLNQKIAEIKNLTWMPYIGDDYEKAPTNKKILIIGESHYGQGADIMNPNFTNEIIRDMAINRNYDGIKIFLNLHLALFGNDNFNTQKFYTNVSFYNFVQRPMSLSIERPSPQDYVDGWGSFFNLIEVLKPSCCLFIGVTAFNYFSDVPNFVAQDIGHSKVDSVWPRKKILTSGQYSLPCYFIKHTSKFFSWPSWNEYLKNNIGEQLSWLESKLQ